LFSKRQKQPRIFTEEEARISTEGPCESVAVSVISVVVVGVVVVVSKKRFFRNFRDAARVGVRVGDKMSVTEASFWGNGN
jgi:hypothetical protein